MQQLSGFSSNIRYLFPALGILYLFSCAWQPLYTSCAYPLSVSRACHPLSISRAWQPYLLPPLCIRYQFPAFGNCYLFPALCIRYLFPALGNSYTFLALGTRYLFPSFGTHFGRLASLWTGLWSSGELGRGKSSFPPPPFPSLSSLFFPQTESLFTGYRLARCIYFCTFLLFYFPGGKVIGRSCSKISRFC